MENQQETNLFACQTNSYLQELKTTVVSCKPAKLKKTVPGRKPEILSGYEVVFEDTILFPEGGGQNDDHGTVNGLPVVSVKRQNGQAVHFVVSNEPLQKSDEVVQLVDWTRRFDNMQQHSGQHLVSALFERLLNVPTASWWMAENGNNKVGVSYIELDAETVTEDQTRQVEDACNDAIRKHLNVDVHVFKAGDSQLEQAKTRGLPEDHKGSVRVIEIGSGEDQLDSNMCCGTHVTNLSHLQVVKLLSVEQSKRKGKCNLYFVVGSRAIRLLDTCHKREKGLISVLNNAPEDHIDLVEKMTRNVRLYQKSTQSLLKELALIKAAELKDKKPQFFSTHRNETESDYTSVLINELAEENITLFITTGVDKNASMTLYGPEDVVKDLGPRLLPLLEAKGGGKGKRLNAKVTSLKHRSKVDDLLNKYFASSK